MKFLMPVEYANVRIYSRSKQNSKYSWVIDEEEGNITLYMLADTNPIKYFKSIGIRIKSFKYVGEMLVPIPPKWTMKTAHKYILTMDADIITTLKMDKCVVHPTSKRILDEGYMK